MTNLHLHKLFLFLLLIIGSLAVTTPAQTHGHGQAQTQAQTGSPSQADELALQNVAAVHGMAGPFAVAGYRMGRRAMTELELNKGSFGLEVVHDAPPEVQWSCIADGLQAATGASMGKLNLRMNVIKDSSGVCSTVINRKSGGKIIFRLRDSFLKRFLNVPIKDLSVAGRETMNLKDEEIFTMEIVDEKTKQATPSQH